MNAILTDDECRETLRVWLAEPDTDTQYLIRKVESAVLAKLREQEPVAVVRSSGIEIRGEYSDLIGSNLYAYRVPSDAELYSGGFGFEGCHVFSAANRTNAAPLPAVVPQGYKLVPVEPTDKMVQAAHHLDLSYMPGQEGADRAAIYRAMLAAAPEAPATAVVQVPQAFADWLCREMPPGTVISDPAWWAPRIARAMLAAAPEAPAQTYICTETMHTEIPCPKCKPLPALPADVREALKVAREALAAAEQGLAVGYGLTRVKVQAALARIDGLGGGE